MDTVEELALKAYPKMSRITELEGTLIGDGNVDKREGFIEGYNQAKQDLIDKAKAWFTDNIPSEKVQLLWCDFELFIAENWHENKRIDAW